jgi:hypothetical protein
MLNSLIAYRLRHSRRFITDSKIHILIQILFIEILTRSVLLQLALLVSFL